jgi:hypothetical protein
MYVLLTPEYLNASLDENTMSPSMRAFPSVVTLWNNPFSASRRLEASAAAAPGDPFVWRRLLDARHPKSNVGLYTTELVSRHRDVYRRHDRGQMVPVLRANLIQTRCKTCYKSVISF